MTGTIYSWGRSNQVFGGLEARRDQVSFVTVDVELDAPEASRVLGVLKGPEVNLRVGAAVTGSIDRPSEASKDYAAVRWTLSDRSLVPQLSKEQQHMMDMRGVAAVVGVGQTPWYERAHPGFGVQPRRARSRRRR